MSVKGWSVVFEGNRFEADLVAAALEAHGIRTEVFGFQGFGTGLNLGNARILVPDGQAGAARRLIKAAETAPRRPEPEEEV